jgi:two-component system phosphate regulon sensor histidine kinase PhoR
MRLSLRSKIMIAILAAVIATEALAVWAINRRIEAGASRESNAQAQAQAAQARALYTERANTLLAEGEAVSFYPAVIAAIEGQNAQPLLTWSSRVNTAQGSHVTVVNKDGKVVARGHDPDRKGDDLTNLEGVRMALAGEKVSGAEEGDELGLALRGYAPVRQQGTSGAIVGAVMIADAFDDRLLDRLGGSEGRAADLRVEAGAGGADRCDSPAGRDSATCSFSVTSPSGRPAATVALSVPLLDIDEARADARRAAWLVLAGVLVAGVAGSWLLSGSLTRRLGRLTGAAQSIAAGDFDRPTGVGGSDEIGVLARSLDTMREQVGAATGALKNERDVLDAVLGSVEDGILMTEHSGRVAVANGRWRELLGGTGLPAARDLVRIGGAGGTFAQAAAGWLKEPERVAGADFERFDPYRRFRCYTAPVRLPERDRGTPEGSVGTVDAGHAAPVGRIFVMRDVTKESEAERMRTALVSTVSHELRSPLTAIKGYTDTLLDSGPWDTDTEREFLEIIRVSTEKLSLLVDNLLDAAKMEAGVLTLEREPIRVERIVEQVVAQRRRLAPNHPLTTEIDADLPMAEADPLRVEQVITNLVENAIKYSPDGGPVTVRVRGGEMITVSVSDHGVGITPEQAEHLFERFYRVDSSLARTTKGVGLGLFICRSLVEAHGGRIWVESTPGQGSTFSFTLPTLASTERGTRSAEPGAVTLRLRVPEGVVT